jgi:hypothetical protein
MAFIALKEIELFGITYEPGDKIELKMEDVDYRLVKFGKVKYIEDKPKKPKAKPKKPKAKPKPKQKPKKKDKSKDEPKKDDEPDGSEHAGELLTEISGDVEVNVEVVPKENGE